MRILFVLVLLFLAASCRTEHKEQPVKKEKTTSLMAGGDTLIYPEEKHFKSIRQITFGGDNAEAYWSWDDKQMIFQSNNTAWGMECD